MYTIVIIIICLAVFIGVLGLAAAAFRVVERIIRGNTDDRIRRKFLQRKGRIIRGDTDD